MQGEGRPGNMPVAWFSPERAEPRIDRRFREGRIDRLGKALQPIDNSDEDILDPAIAELGHHREPELGAFILSDPEAKDLALAIACDAKGKIHSLVFDDPAVLIPDLHP